MWALSFSFSLQKYSKISPKSFVSKEESIDEDSAGWISINTKNEIEKRNTNSRRENKLSNIRDSTIKFTVEQDFDFGDSDEDFMITEDNAKKFNESSFFTLSIIYAGQQPYW